MSEQSQFLHAEQQILINVLHGMETSISSEDLEHPKHQVILKVAEELRSEGITPDLVGLHHRLTDKNLIQDAGGVSYLTKLYDGLPTKKLDNYETLVKEARVRRRVLDVCKGIIYSAEEGATTDELLVRLQTEPIDITYKTKMDSVLLQDVIIDEVEVFINQAHNKGEVNGVKTGFEKLDEMTHGLQPSDLIIVAGRPSMGKTALATQICMNVARTQGPAFICSVEMDKSSLIERIISEVSGVDADRIRGRMFDRNEADKMRNAALIIQDYHPVIINDTPRLSATEAKMHISQAHAKYGLKIAMVDYLGLLRPDISKQRYLEIAESTQIMRATARELRIPVMLLCQLNRGVEHRDDKRPILSDLRESGDIEQDADVVLMLYRAEYYCDKCQVKELCEEDHKEKAQVFIRKQRKGKIGGFTLRWEPKNTKFQNFTGGSYGEGNY